MVSKKTLLSLVEQALKGDSTGVEMLVRRLASKLKSNEPEIAKELMMLLPEMDGMRSVASFTPTPVDTDSRQKLLIEYYPVELEYEPVLSTVTQKRLQQIVSERQKSDLLMQQGLKPIRSVLFDGAPGLGKTLTAKWLARELDLPLLVLDLATVMSSYLGKTGSNIRSVLKYAISFPCVLLLDEFDAIAKRRDDDHDVGELKRLVTVLLQAIDDWPHTSLLVAATNHGELLDPAVWRRFDLNIHFDLPDSGLVEEYLKLHDIGGTLLPIMTSSFTDKSFSDIEREVNILRKTSVLDQRPLLDVFVESHTSNTIDNSKLKRDMEILRLHGEGVSQREITKRTGVSRPTVSNIINKAAGD